MRIPLGEIVIRDMQPKDVPALREIVSQPGIVRFMRDWFDNSRVPGRMEGYVDWLASQSDSTDVRENKRYAVALSETDQLIGMVGMGLEETVGEVEVAYFMSQAYQRRGYTARAVKALTQWCFSVSDLPWLILTVDCANTPSHRTAEACGFQLFERRTPVGHKQHNMVSDSYDYYRLYRK